MPYSRRFYPYRKRNFGRRKGWRKGKTYAGRKFRKSFKTRLTSMKSRTTVMPDKAYVKLKATDFYTLTISQGNTVAQVDYAGNYFDSEYPAGLQQWAQFYSRYRVLGNKLKVQVWNQDNDGVGGVVGLYPYRSPDADGGWTATHTNVLDQPYVQSKIINQGGTSSRAYLNSFMSSKKMFGQKVTTDDTFQGTFTSAGANTLTATDPSAKWNWFVFYSVADSVPVGYSYELKLCVTQTFYIVLEDRRVFEAVSTS